MSTLTPTVRGGFWGDLGSSSLVLRNENVKVAQIARMIDVDGMRYNKEVWNELTGEAEGEAALATYYRVKAGETDSIGAPSELGGLRTVESVTVVNTTTTAANETDMEKLTTWDSNPTYVSNLDGNPRGYGGG